MKAATLFSGIGAPEVAMPHWQWLWHAEIEQFPNAVMKHHFPQSKNLGDVNAEDFIERAERAGQPDVLVFGSPCQSFSIAGRRLGLDDPRGNLALVALGIVNRLKPGWFVFENVPGLLSSAEGRDFGLFLRAVDELGYSGAWSVLDAQYFGLAQRRERVFFVGCLGDWRNSAAVLFEPESLCGNTPPRREPGQGITHDIAPCIGESGRGFERAGDTRGQDAVVAWALQERDYKGADSSTKEGHLIVANSVGTRTTRHDPSVETMIVADPIQANEHRTYSTAGNNPRARNCVIAFDETQITSQTNRSNPKPGDASHPLAATSRAPLIVENNNAPIDGELSRTENMSTGAMREMRKQKSGGSSQERHLKRQAQTESAETLSQLSCEDTSTEGHLRHMQRADEGSRLLQQAFHSVQEVGKPTRDKNQSEHASSGVRRLTPSDCEILQGFPRGYTDILYRRRRATDSPRYRALGNAMAVPVLRWILSRIESVNRQGIESGEFPQSEIP